MGLSMMLMKCVAVLVWALGDQRLQLVLVLSPSNEEGDSEEEEEELLSHQAELLQYRMEPEQAQSGMEGGCQLVDQPEPPSHGGTHAHPQQTREVVAVYQQRWQ